MASGQGFGYYGVTSKGRSPWGTTEVRVFPGLFDKQGADANPLPNTGSIRFRRQTSADQAQRFRSLCLAKGGGFDFLCHFVDRQLHT